jgi:CBS domain-containing protein
VSRDRLGKRTPISDIDDRLDIPANVVRADTDLLAVARQAMEHPQTRVLAVVDDAGRLVGVLPVLRVAEEVVARAAPEALMADVVDVETAGLFGREVAAHVAGDLMAPPAFLGPDATVGDALRSMHEHGYPGLPIVDAERRVIGYVDLLELALHYLGELEAPPPPEAAPGRGPLADRPA